MTIASRLLAAGTGWSVHDVVCDHGPGDRAFEERHATVCIAAVTAGTFQYRTRQGTTTLAPGNLLLGNADACFECGHAHGHGDRCLAFHYAPDYFEEILADTPGIRGAEFIRAGLPPLQQLMPLLAELVAAREHDDAEAFEELAVRLAAAARTLQADAPPAARRPTAQDEKRITAALRRIEARPQAPLTLAQLAREAGMSSYHFLRIFRQVAGLTPHQYLVRIRLHRAALSLRLTTEPVTAIAYDCGFNDLSTFNRQFRRMIGVSPKVWRAAR